MSEFYEIDFMDVKSSKSGDAIAIRYQSNGRTHIHVVDGGYKDTGQILSEHIKTYYGNPGFIDHVIVTHSDGDHVCGLIKILEEFEIGQLWMLRPWVYAAELIDRFSRFTSIDNLTKRLKECYPYIAQLEELANKKNVPIMEPFQGAIIGSFVVLAPKKTRYLDLVVESDKTPESFGEDEETAAGRLRTLIEAARAKVVNFVRVAWGAEIFSEDPTSNENEMCVVQYANLCDHKIVLTGDCGRDSLEEAADYVSMMGWKLPGVDKFQVPHHGSRRNVSTEILDRWLGPRLASPEVNEGKFEAIISAAEDDKDHPRKAVVRAMIHRGGRVFTTEGHSLRTSKNAPVRTNWSSAVPVEYPDEQEK